MNFIFNLCYCLCSDVAWNKFRVNSLLSNHLSYQMTVLPAKVKHKYSIKSCCSWF